MRRKGEQRKKKTVKGNEMIAFIDVLIDLLLYNQHQDWERKLTVL